MQVLCGLFDRFLSGLDNDAALTIFGDLEQELQYFLFFPTLRPFCQTGILPPHFSQTYVRRRISGRGRKRDFRRAET